MNRLQVGILSTAFIAVLGSLLYPPYAVTLPGGLIKRLGHGWIFSPPRVGVLQGGVEASSLMAQILGIVVLTVLAYLIAGNIAGGKALRSEGADESDLRRSLGFGQHASQLRIYAAKLRKPAEVVALLAVVVLVTGLGKVLAPSLLGLVAPTSSSQSSGEALEKTAATLRAGLPRDVDEATRMVDVRSGPGARLTYFYELRGPSELVSDRDKFRSGLDTPVKSRVCTIEETRKLIDRGIVLSYSYRDTTKTHMVQIDVTKEACQVLGRLLGTWRCRVSGKGESQMIYRYIDDGRLEITRLTNKWDKRAESSGGYRWYLTDELSVQESLVLGKDDLIELPPLEIRHLSAGALSLKTKIEEGGAPPGYECERMEQ